MKAFLPGLVLSWVLALALPAAAQVAGAWFVSGKVAGTPFASDCRFEDQGGGFGGVCVDSAVGNPRGKPGTVHKLTKGEILGGQVLWAYPASFLLATFSVEFTGVLAGDHITGVITAFGRKGDFTATRK